MKKIKRIAVLLLAVSLTAMIFTACGGSKTDAAGGSGSTSTLILVDQDSNETTYTLEKSIGMDFRNGLVEEGLVAKEDSAAFMIERIDGHEALMEDGVLWMLCDENKEQIPGLYEENTIEAGKTYYIVYTVAPNFDD